MWQTRTGLEASTSRQPASRPTSGGHLRDSDSSKEWAEVDRWLMRKYHSEEYPSFERTEDSRKFLLRLLQLTEAQEKSTRETIQKLETLSTIYREEAIVLTETLQLLGIQQKKLSREKQEILSQLSELALVLGLSDMRLSSFHQGLAQVRLDTLESLRKDAEQMKRISSLRCHRADAQLKLLQLMGLKRQWREQREAEGDLELRTKRRSTELNRIKAAEDKTVLEDALASRRRHKRSRPSPRKAKGAAVRTDAVADGDVDVELSGLTIAQLDLKEKSVVELQQLLDAQKTSLAAYQEIPLDYALARLKVKEATMRLEELTLEHESKMTQLAEDL